MGPRSPRSDSPDPSADTKGTAVAGRNSRTGSPPRARQVQLAVVRRGGDGSDGITAARGAAGLDPVLQQWAEMDVGAVATATITETVKQRPVLFSVWAVGLLLAFCAVGVPVSEASFEAFNFMRQQAEVIDSRELGRALDQLQQDENRYYAARGWFGACDKNCAQARDRLQLTQGEVERLQKNRDKVLSEGRREVGIWSPTGVQDVRDSFWRAWKSGKDFAARCTMMDAMFLTMRGRDEFMVIILRLVIQYVLNLTLGLIGAFFFFLANVYSLLVSYGENVLSACAFFLLATIAGLSTVSAYLGGMYGVVVGGGMMLMKQAALQAKLQNGPDGEAVCGRLQNGAATGPALRRCPV